MRRLGALALILFLSGLICRSALAGLGPENVAVIVNEDSWASKAVANEFIALHNIPPANVIYIKNLPDFEYTNIEFLRKQLLAPILQTLERRGLTAQIDCVAWSADIPYSVIITKDFTAKPPLAVGSVGSINGLTYLYQFVFADKQHAPPGSYALPDNNRYFRRPIAPRTRPPLTAAQQRRLMEAGRLLYGDDVSDIEPDLRPHLRGDDWMDAEAILCALLDECPDCAEARYFLAICLAHRGDLDAAVQSLRRAADGGWANWRAWLDNKTLAPLRNRKDFQEALDRCKAVRVDVAPTLGFSSDCGWNVQGEKVAPGKGPRYLLSVVLAVTSGRGNSVPEALDSLRAAAGADGACPSGTFYFMQNNDIRSAVRDWLFPSAIEKLREMGLTAELEEGILPKDKPDVMGAVIGQADYNWKASGSKILSGAICENMTSCGGMLAEGDSQTPLTSLIACGAAGSSGAVTEPYAIAQKFPSPFIHLHYARGCTLAEAFYQSVATPYQLLIVGDPLCAPWLKRPTVVVAGLTPGRTIAGAFTLKPSTAPSSDAPAQQFEIYVDGRRRGRIAPGESIQADARQLDDGYHELRVVAVTGGPLEERTGTVLPITVDKSGRQLKISGPEGDAPWDRPLRLRAELAGAAEIRFLHNLRPIGVIHAEEGAIAVDPLILGQGPCRIQCVAVDAGQKVMAVSPFIELRVVPPAPAPAIAPPEGRRLEKGILLTPEGGAPVAVTDTRRNDWLSAAGVKEGKAFTLEGFFDAPEEGVCQFQVRSNVSPIIELDGQTIHRPKPKPSSEEPASAITIQPAGEPEWTFLPVSLAKGLHRLRVTGVGVSGSMLDIRFGGHGTQSIGGAFKHVTTEK